MNTSVFRYQRFALEVARATSADLGGDNRRQVRVLQRLLTPATVNAVSYLCYVILAVGFVFAFRAWGWLGAGPMLVWAYLGTWLLYRVWPVPSQELCTQIATAEVRREGQLPNLEPDERELVQAAVLNRLKA
ncbi:MAG TPA: hypothetical protein VMW62_09400 [Chloroflexota bacterium]|nr:hypothetical protein [Chloroflexota bacterium]